MDKGEVFTNSRCSTLSGFVWGVSGAPGVQGEVTNSLGQGDSEGGVAVGDESAVYGVGVQLGVGYRGHRHIKRSNESHMKRQQSHGHKA